MLILHGNPEFDYSAETQIDCDQHGLSECESAIVQTSGQDPIALYVLAAFPETTDPQVYAVSFGIEYDACIDLLDWRHCGDLEGPYPGWPESGASTGCGWDVPQSGFDLLPVYSFNGNGLWLVKARGMDQHVGDPERLSRWKEVIARISDEQLALPR